LYGGGKAMRKNLNKLIAFGIGLSVMSANIVPALGDEAVNKEKISISNESIEKRDLNVLSLQDVIDAGISHDDQMKIYSNQIKYYKDLEDYYDEKDDDFGEDENNINIDSTKQSKQFRSDAVEHEMIMLYNNILLLQKQIELQENVVRNKIAETESFETKVKIGLKTSIELETQKHDLQKEKDTLQDENNRLKDLKKKLTLMTGINIEDYFLDDTLKFNPLKIEDDLDDYIDDKINTITKYSKELVDLYEDETDDLEDDDYDDIESLIDSAENKVHESDYQTEIVDSVTGETTLKTNSAAYKAAKESAKDSALQEYKGYLELRMLGENKKSQLNIQEKTYKNTLRSAYTDMLAMEKKINQMINEINTTNKILLNLKVKYDLGLIAENDYSIEIVKYRQMDIELRKQANSYYELVTAFEKPWAIDNSLTNHKQD